MFRDFLRPGADALPSFEKFRKNPKFPFDRVSALTVDDLSYISANWQPRTTVRVRLDSDDAEVPEVFAAAYFGAAKCFDFLAHKSVTGIRARKSGWSVADAAVAGGSLEILRTLEEKKVKFGDWELRKKAVRFHRPLVFLWLQDRVPVEDKRIEQSLALARKYGDSQIERILLVGNEGKRPDEGELLAGY